MHSERWVTEHREIIDALSTGDCSEARTATRAKELLEWNKELIERLAH